MVKKRSFGLFRRKAQISMEYIMLVSFILIIMIPVGNFMYTAISDLTTNYEINKLDSYMNEVVSKSKEVYFMGLYSKLSITPDLNSRAYTVNQVFTAELNDSTSIEYHFVLLLDYDGLTKRFIFDSEVPLMTNQTCFISADTTYFPECTALTCKICILDNEDFIKDKLIISTIINDSILKVELRNEK